MTTYNAAASDIAANSCKDVNRTHQHMRSKPPVYLDAIQLGIQLFSADLIGGSYQKESILKNYPIPLYFPNARTRVSKSGYVSIGDRFGFRRYLSTCGARLARVAIGAPMMLGKNCKERRIHDNQLSLEEKKMLGEFCPDSEPWELIVNDLLSSLPVCLNEAKQHVTKQNSRILDIHPAAVTIRRIQFYREYPTSSKSLDALMDHLVQGIAPSLGAYQSSIQSCTLWKEKGALRRWEIQVRGQPGVRRKRSEKATLIAYYKGNQLRVEVSRDSPAHPTIFPNDQSAMFDVISGFAADAMHILDKIHDQLKPDPTGLQESEIYAAIKAYGVRQPEQRTPWMGFVDQIIRTETFDNSRARFDGHRICYKMLSQKLANEHTGLLTRGPRLAINRACVSTNKFLYALRPDWRQQVAQALAAQKERKRVSMSDPGDHSQRLAS